MMQNLVCAMRMLAVTLVLTVFGAGGASAQPYWDRVSSAERQMNAADRDGRFALAARQCRDAIDRRRAEWITVWCDLAARAADRQRSRARRHDYAEEELSLLWDVAWLQAVEGVQQNGFLAGPPIERANIADDATRVRRLAYLILGGLRGRDLRDAERHVRELGRIEGVNISPEETLLIGRRRLLGTLLTQPRTPDRLWAIAAIALTFNYEYRAAVVASDAVAADAAEVAALLADIEVGTEALTGQDIALHPLLSYAHAQTLFAAHDYQGAQRTAHAAAMACGERLWNRSSLCLDISSTAGLAQLMAELTAQNPDRMALPVEEPLSARQRGVEYTEARCRVIVVGDIGNDGAFTNVRVAHEAPASVCRQMALSYATSRRYRPIAQAQPGRRRQDIVLRFVLTSP